MSFFELKQRHEKNDIHLMSHLKVKKKVGVTTKKFEIWHKIS